MEVLATLLFALSDVGDRPAFLVAAAVPLVVAAAILRQRRQRPASLAPRDPDREFKPSTRAAVFDAARRRCEFDCPVPWVRCPRRAEHADHFFPWTSGGASSMANCVAACARHNLSKGARMPSRGLGRGVAGPRPRTRQPPNSGRGWV
ncbi:MAG: HNH endonuclease signature motif containing protein, partial [Curtobacterium sp.]